MNDERTVEVGDRQITINRFRGLKAIMASALVARVMREMPQVQVKINAFIKEYRASNTMTVTPAMGKMPSFAYLGLTPEDFEAGGGTVELPDEPTNQQVMFHIVPDLLELALKEVQRFLALVVIPNSELEKADDADEVEVVLDREGKALMRAGDIDQLLELVVVGWEVMENQILQKSDRLGKLQKLPFVQTLLSMGQSSISEEESESEMTEETPSTPQMSLQDAPNLSTDSDDSTDGIEEPLSTVSPGTSS